MILVKDVTSYRLFRENTQLSFFICYATIDYSMIETTVPNPIVRPPSRYQTGALQCTNGDFSFDLCGKIRISHCVCVVFGDFVIMVLSLHF